MNKDLQTLPLPEFFNHVQTVLSAKRELYSVEYLLDVAVEAKRRGFPSTQECLLDAAAKRVLWAGNRTGKSPASE